MKTDNEVKTTVRLEKDTHKLIKKFCVDHDISMQDFCANSMIHCMEKKIIPKK
ncbi:MAG: hypothetical protein GY754_34630 [bacterium]|nr:hypothetical protein [bacterium]